MGRGALQAIVLRVRKSWTQLRQLSMHTYMCTCVYMCVCLCVYVYMNVYVCVCVCVCVCVYSNLALLGVNFLPFGGLEIFISLSILKDIFNGI